MSKTAKTQAQAHNKPAHDLAQDSESPSASMSGVKKSTIARGGVELKNVSPGKSGGANLA